MHPVKYYLIDFGLSTKYDDNASALERPVRGGDKTVPEFQNGAVARLNPFPLISIILATLFVNDFSGCVFLPYPTSYESDEV